MLGRDQGGTGVPGSRRGSVPVCPELLEAKVKEIQSRIRGLRMLAEDLRRLQRAAVWLPAKELTAPARFCHIPENKRFLKAANAARH